MTDRASEDDDGFATVHLGSKSTTDRASVDDDGFSTVHIGGNTTVRECKGDEDGAVSNGGLSVGLAQEHFFQQLPRRMPDRLQPSGFRLCLPGEMQGPDGEPAKLYDPFSSSNEEIGEFGPGVALYFKTLKLMFFVMLLFAAASPLAMNPNKKYNPDGTTTVLQGSTLGATRESLTLSGQGLFDLIVTAVLMVVALASGHIQDSVVDAIDRRHLTPSDYSVVVDNPPRNISDPAEYRQFFSKFGDVVLVTIAVNNGGLITALKEKKVFEAKVSAQERYKANAGENNAFYNDSEHLGCMQRMLQPYGLYETLGYVRGEVDKREHLLSALVQADYHPWRVYVTFAKQEGQLRCLRQCSVSYFALVSGSAPGSDANMNGCLLNVNKAPEPSDILYESSQYSKANRWFRTILSYSLAGVMLALCFVVVGFLSRFGSSAVAVFISFINAIVPVCVINLTYGVEVHVKSSDQQMSTLLKLVVVRCINSGVLIYLTVDEAQRFSVKHLEHVQSILIADAVTTPFLRFLDISGMLNRYVFAKSVATQEELNTLYSPTDWTLAERYTDLLKTLFVGCFFAVPLPSGLIITCCAMFTTYVVDKYSLMRIWRRPPLLDESLSTTARFFFMFVVFAHIAVTKNYFAGWPFSYESQEASEGCRFLVCGVNDDMGKDQQTLVTTYNVLSLLVFTVVAFVLLVVYFGGWLLSLFSQKVDQNAFMSSEDLENDQSYRELTSQSAYVPVIEPLEMSEPLIMADISNLPTKYLPLKRNEIFNDNVDPASFSVARHEELPTVNDAATLNSLFTRVVYYEQRGKEFVPYTKPEFIAGATLARNSSGEAGAGADEDSRKQSSSAFASAVSLTAGVHKAVDRAKAEHAKAEQVRKPTTLSLQALPAGWEERRSKDGKVYYANGILKTTQWTRPV